jgi:hypothetical protein
MSGGWVDHETCRLVQNEKRVVLVNHIEWARIGFEHPRLGSCFSGVGNSHGVAMLERTRGPGSFVVDRNKTTGNEAGGMRTR